MAYEQLKSLKGKRQKRYVKLKDLQTHKHFDKYNHWKHLSQQQQQQQHVHISSSVIVSVKNCKKKTRTTVIKRKIRKNKNKFQLKLKRVSDSAKLAHLGKLWSIQSYVQ